MDEYAKHLLDRCKRDIIEKYSGNREFVLKHSDYLTLAGEIYNASRILLSLSTLRRLFDENYSGSPKISTLNALAIYLGYDNWKEYYKENKGGKYGIGKAKNKLSPRKKALIFIIILVLPCIYFIITKSLSFGNDLVTDITFFYNTDFDSTRIPVTVTFNYNIKHIKKDSVYFHPMGYQGKDDIRFLNPQDTTATYTYLYPGCYYPKLVVNGEIIAQQRINFNTNKWIASILKQKPFYVKYISDEDIFKHGEMAFTDDILKKADYPLSEVEQTCYHLFKDFSNLNGDSICFETRIKNELIERSANSGIIVIDLFFEAAAIHMTFDDEKTSYQDLGLLIIDNYHSSDTQNLSFLNRNFKDWSKIKFNTSNNKFNLFTDDSLVFETGYKKKTGELMGIRYTFNGLGEVDYIRFYDQGGKLIYNDEFDLD